MVTDLGTYVTQIYERTIEIIIQPGKHTEMVWILAPLAATLILMELYFSRYEDEELGWNTAFGNSLVLIFVSASLIKNMFLQGLLSTNLDPVKLGTVIAVLLVGFILTVLDYFHATPEKIAFGLSSRLPINFLAYSAILIVYGSLPIDMITAAGFIIVLLLVAIALRLINDLVPKFREILIPEPPEPSEQKPY